MENRCRLYYNYKLSRLIREQCFEEKKYHLCHLKLFNQKNNKNQNKNSIAFATVLFCIDTYVIVFYLHVMFNKCATINYWCLYLFHFECFVVFLRHLHYHLTTSAYIEHCVLPIIVHIQKLTSVIHGQTFMQRTHSVVFAIPYTSNTRKREEIDCCLVPSCSAIKCCSGFIYISSKNLI